MSNLRGAPCQVAVSIVNHGHSQMVLELLSQIDQRAPTVEHVILTENICPTIEVDPLKYSFRLSLVRNSEPKGFGANHNQAFKLCNSDYFCVLNPDIQISEDPFCELVDVLADRSIGIVCPLVLDSCGAVEDSFRFFPTPFALIKKLVYGFKDSYPIDRDSQLVFPDWVAGMCMLFRKEDYEQLDGFDEGYFLYYEDIDLCLRFWREGKKVALSVRSTVIHNARRESHRNLWFLKIHLESIARFFLKHWLRFPKRR